MKRTLIAAAVLSTMAAGSAYADCKAGCDPAELFTATNIYTDIGEFGFITLRGKVDVSSSSGATVNNTQSVNIDGVDMKTPPQSYTSGKVTTAIDTSKSWFDGSGSGSNYSVHSSYSAGSFAEGSKEQSAAAYAQGKSFGESSGFSQGFEGSYAGGNHASTSKSASGYLAAGFIAGFGGGGVIFGGFASGFAAGLNTHSSDNYGGYFAEQSSGHQAAWGQEHSSGYFAQAAEQSASGYYRSSHVSADANAWGWSAHDSISEGSVNVYGYITQHIDTQKPTVMSASIGKGALEDAMGNVGVNMATGVDNAQSNDAALSNMDVGPVFGTAQIYSTQSSDGKAKIGDFKFVASVGSDVLKGASGNIGVNVASGVGNVQNNSLAASATTDSSDHGGWNRRGGGMNGGEVIASDQNCQTADASVSGQFTGSAMLGAGALANADGNIGVNIASGVGNLQHNGLAVASVSHQ